MIPWDRFRATVAEASALARSEEFDPYQLLGEHYAGVRRWTPALLATFAFQGVPAPASLLRDRLRRIGGAGRPLEEIAQKYGLEKIKPKFSLKPPARCSAAC